MRYGFVNNFSQTLAAELTDVATTLTLDGGGALISNVGNGLVYRLTLDDGNGVVEIVEVTSSVGNDLTVTRGMEGTAAAAWPAGTVVEMRMTAAQAEATVTTDGNNNTVSKGATAAGNHTGRVAIGHGAVASATEALALGDALAGADSSVAIGRSASAYGNHSMALGREASTGGMSGDPSVDGYRAIALGYNAIANGKYGEAIGYQTYAKAAWSAAIGYKAESLGSASVAVGYKAKTGSTFGDENVSGYRATAIGRMAEATGSMSMAAGADAGAAGDYSAALGARAVASGNESVALGPGPSASIDGGAVLGALPYLTAAFTSSSDELDYTSPPAARQASAQAVLQTQDIDLTSAAAVQTLDMPVGVRMFIDSIDVIVTGIASPGGSPQINVGTGAGTPADILSAAAVTKTAVGGRDTHSPLSADGVSTIHVSVATAGTGTTYTARVVVRGYVMEI